MIVPENIQQTSLQWLAANITSGGVYVCPNVVGIWCTATYENKKLVELYSDTENFDISNCFEIARLSKYSAGNPIEKYFITLVLHIPKRHRKELSEIYPAETDEVIILDILKNNAAYASKLSVYSFPFQSILRTPGISYTKRQATVSANIAHKNHKRLFYSINNTWKIYLESSFPFKSLILIDREDFLDLKKNPEEHCLEYKHIYFEGLKRFQLNLI